MQLGPNLDGFGGRDLVEVVEHHDRAQVGADAVTFAELTVIECPAADVRERVDTAGSSATGIAGLEVASPLGVDRGGEDLSGECGEGAAQVVTAVQRF